jgi:hypothetical protein
VCDLAWRIRDIFATQKQQGKVLLRPFRKQHRLISKLIFKCDSAVTRCVEIAQRRNDRNFEDLPRRDPRPVIDLSYGLFERHDDAPIIDQHWGLGRLRSGALVRAGAGDKDNRAGKNQA